MTDVRPATLSAMAKDGALSAATDRVLSLEAAQPSLVERMLNPLRRALGQDVAEPPLPGALAALRAQLDSTLEAALTVSLQHKPQELAALRADRTRLGDLAMGARALRNMGEGHAVLAELAAELPTRVERSVQTAVATSSVAAMSPGLLTIPAIEELYMWHDIRRAMGQADAMLLRSAAPQAMPALQAANGGTMPDFRPTAAALGTLRSLYNSPDRHIVAGIRTLQTAVAGFAPIAAVLPAALEASETEVRHLSATLRRAEALAIRTMAMREDDAAAVLYRDIERAETVLARIDPLPGCGVLELTQPIGQPVSGGKPAAPQRRAATWPVPAPAPQPPRR